MSFFKTNVNGATSHKNVFKKKRENSLHIKNGDEGSVNICRKVREYVVILHTNE